VSSEYKYRAFISYSHKDEKWASWLHKALETFKIPKYLVGETTGMGTIPERMGKVFRDREELSSSHSLGSELTQALEDSACQVVICSPNAANSHWTNEEILTYKRLGRESRIFCLIVDGEPGTDQECFPEAVRFQMGADGVLSDRPAEPIAADGRPQGDGKQNAKLKLISGMLGVGFDALKQREHQRRQKRMAIITVSAVAGMVVAIGLATMAVLARNEAEVQRQQAEIEAERSRQTTDFLVGLFAVSDPNEAQGNSITVREILDKGTEDIEADLASQPEIQAILMETMGTVYRSLALYPSSATLLQSALNKRRELYGDEHLEVARTAHELGTVLKLTAEYEQSEAMYREALTLRQELLGPEHVDIASTSYEFADLLSRMGNFAEADPLFREALAMQRSLLGDDNPEVAKSLEGLALNLYDQGDYDNSLVMMRDAVALQRALNDKPNTNLAEALNNLGFLLGEVGEYYESEQLFREALTMKRILFQGEPHPEIAMGLNNVAFALKDQGKLVEAEPLYREAIAMQKEVYGSDHPDVGLALNNLAFLLYDKGGFEAAISMSREALATFRSTLGDEHPYVSSSMNNLGMWLLARGDYEQSEPLLREALSLGRTGLGEDHLNVADSLTLLADLQIKSELYDEAYVMAVDARTIYEDALGRNHWRTAAAISAEGAALAGQQDYDAAERLLKESFDILNQEPGALPYFKRETAARLVSLYHEWGKPALAAEILALLDD
jgi:tetratricopeptide (TPR) repeat protein